MHGYAKHELRKIYVLSIERPFSRAKTLEKEEETRLPCLFHWPEDFLNKWRWEQEGQAEDEGEEAKSAHDAVRLFFYKNRETVEEKEEGGKPVALHRWNGDGEFVEEARDEKTAKTAPLLPSLGVRGFCTARAIIWL